MVATQDANVFGSALLDMTGDEVLEKQRSQHDVLPASPDCVTQ